MGEVKNLMEWLKINPLFPIIPTLSQIQPLMIPRFDQGDLLGSQPTLDLFFPQNRIFHIFEFFDMDKFMESISLCKPLYLSLFVLPCPPDDIMGHSRVKYAVVFIGHDVDIISLLHFWILLDTQFELNENGN